MVKEQINSVSWFGKELQVDCQLLKTCLGCALFVIILVKLEIGLLKMKPSFIWNVLSRKSSRNYAISSNVMGQQLQTCMPRCVSIYLFVCTFSNCAHKTDWRISAASCLS